MEKKELTEAQQQIVDLEWEVDTHRIMFARCLAAGQEEAAARHDRIVRDLLDQLTQLYGREELNRRAA